MKYRNSLVACVAILCVVGCSTNSVSRSASRYFGTFKPAELQMNAQQGGLVFYRDTAGVNARSVNISINGEYLASLPENTMTQIAVCAKPMHLTTEYTGAEYDQQYARKLAAQGAVAEVSVGSILYVKIITNEAQQPILQVVEPELAKQALLNIKTYPHNLPRLSLQQTCQ